MRPKKWSKQSVYIPFIQIIHLWRTDKKNSGLGTNSEGRKACFHSLLSPEFPLTGNKNVSPAQVQEEGSSAWGDLILALRRT